MQKERLQQQLKAKTRLDTESDCWLWKGQVSNSGHGRIKIKDYQDAVRMVSAETASYMAFFEDVPEGQLVGKTCSNRLCINPDHLELKPLL